MEGWTPGQNRNRCFHVNPLYIFLVINFIPTHRFFFSVSISKLWNKKGIGGWRGTIVEICNMEAESVTFVIKGIKLMV